MDKQNTLPIFRWICLLYLIRFPVDRSFQFSGRLEKNNAPRRNVYRCHIAGIVHCAGFPCPLFQCPQAPEIALSTPASVIVLAISARVYLFSFIMILSIMQ
jgi:hypothetical protein